jgi:hypothetical protein
MSYGKACPPQGPDQDIVQYIGPEVPDMGVVIYGGTAAVETNSSWIEGFKGL